MPGSWTLSLALGLAQTGDPPVTEPDGIHWEESLEAARLASEADGRPLLLYFTFDT